MPENWPELYKISNNKTESNQESLSSHRLSISSDPIQDWFSPAGKSLNVRVEEHHNITSSILSSCQGVMVTGVMVTGDMVTGVMVTSDMVTSDNVRTYQNLF